MTANMTTAQYRRNVQNARKRHDVDFEANNPRPAPPSDQAAGGWRLTPRTAAWGVLALAGAMISLPHTLNSVMPTVDLSGALATLYSLAVFVGVELALLTVALVTEQKRLESGAVERRQIASLAGLINSLAQRIGFRPFFRLDHLPERQPGGGVLVVLLFGAALVFNLSDALIGVSLLAEYAQTMQLINRLVVGALGPVLLIIAGHRFAAEAAHAMTRGQRLEREYSAALAQWEQARDASWRANRSAYTGDWDTITTSDQDQDGSTWETTSENPLALSLTATRNGNGNGQRSE